jgi:hypothetical protein
MPAMMVRGKGALGGKSVLDIIDAPTRAMKGLDARAAFSSVTDKAAEAALANYRGKPGDSSDAPHVRRKIDRGRRFGNSGIPAHFDKLQT